MPEGTQKRLAEIASGQLEHAELIAAKMMERYAAEIPAYAAITDPVLREDIRSVSAALVRTWLTILATGSPIGAEQLAPIRQGARRRVAQGIDLQSLLRAYRVGIRVMWRELQASPGWAEPQLQEALGRVAEWALEYADTLATEVAGVYLAAAQDAARRREHRRSQFLSVVLAGPTPTGDDPDAELHEQHAVAVAVAAGEPDLAELENIGGLLESRAGVVLWTIRHRHVIGILPAGARRGRAALRDSLAGLLTDARIEAVGLGCDANCPAETRESYAEAVAAVELGRSLAGGKRTVYDYVDLGPVAIMLDQPGQARRLMATTLTPYGPILGHSWGASTLEAFLSCQGHLKEMASRLGIHASTVKYRLQIMRENPAFSCLHGDRAVTVLVALRLSRLLNEPLPRPPAAESPTGYVRVSEVVPFPERPPRPRKAGSGRPG